ncbi:hypothetical protein I4574_11115 [Proteus mirabilis]|nr:hypothetical protein [Proteus mirabilis]MBG2778346.1 hypothetical protein [Proteus mirabilis]MBG2794611.1 hypothetical protein [Proteus mirabilis]HCT2303297.1 hypothetical protein [Proteus mirabilis]
MRHIRINYYALFEKELPNLKSLQQRNDELGFFSQECSRFYTISKTLKTSNINLGVTCTPDTRYITHPLIRSLLENFAAIIYIFDDLINASKRYDVIKNSFKKEYHKLMNSLQTPPWDQVIAAQHFQLETSAPNWASLPQQLDVNSMLTAVKNKSGGRLNYLYVAYRISSFDTHGRSLETIFNAVFGKSCNFPVLNINYTFELIASEYLALLYRLRWQSLSTAKKYRFIK